MTDEVDKRIAERLGCEIQQLLDNGGDVWLHKHGEYNNSLQRVPRFVWAALREKEGEWKDVRKELPDWAQRVIVWDLRSRQAWEAERQPYGSSNLNNWYWWNPRQRMLVNDEVTHWRPLPARPRTEEGTNGK
jgi:hypothetical protein